MLATVLVLISLTFASACCANVCTAASTADLASSDLGLNSLLSSDAKSLPSTVTPANAGDSCSSSAMLTCSDVWMDQVVASGLPEAVKDCRRAGSLRTL